jgi:plasmid stability protein
MPALHVRNVDDAVVEALKKRARRNNRSLQGELHEILERAAREPGSRAPGSRPRVTIKTVDVPGDSTYGREEIYDEEGR